MKKICLWVSAFLLAMMGSMTGKYMSDRKNAAAYERTEKTHTTQTRAPQSVDTKTPPAWTVETKTTGGLSEVYTVAGRQGRIVVFRKGEEDDVLFSSPYSQTWLSDEETECLRRGFEVQSWEEAMLIVEAFLE